MEIITYDDDFVDKVRDLAVIGLYPVQIAERLGMTGRFRQRFLQDICDKKHRLYEVYRISKEHRESDIEASVNELASAGDIEALKLKSSIQYHNDVDNLKNELFGL